MALAEPLAGMLIPYKVMNHESERSHMLVMLDLVELSSFMSNACSPLGQHDVH